MASTPGEKTGLVDDNETVQVPKDEVYDSLSKEAGCNIAPFNGKPVVTPTKCLIRLIVICTFIGIAGVTADFFLREWRSWAFLYHYMYGSELMDDTSTGDQLRAHLCGAIGWAALLVGYLGHMLAAIGNGYVGLFVTIFAGLAATGKGLMWAAQANVPNMGNATLGVTGSCFYSAAFLFLGTVVMVVIIKRVADAPTGEGFEAAATAMGRRRGKSQSRPTGNGRARSRGRNRGGASRTVTPSGGSRNGAGSQPLTINLGPSQPGP